MTTNVFPFKRRTVQPMLMLLLVWPMAGLGLAAAGLAGGYLHLLSGWLVWLAAPALAGAGVGLAILLLKRLPGILPGSVELSSFSYFVMAALAGLGMGNWVVRPFLDISHYPPAENLRVLDAADYAAPGYRHFRDGRIRADLSATYIDSGVDVDGVPYAYHFTVAPVVDDGWRSSDPVTLWVVTGSRETVITDFAAWEGPIQGITRRHEQYLRAIETAAADHKLQSHPAPLLLRLYEQDMATLQAVFRRNLLMFLAIVAVVGWLPLGLYLLRK